MEMEQRVLLAAVLAVCICMELVGTRPAWAQSGPAVQRVEQVMKQLKLTPQQKMALLPVLSEEAPDVEAIRSNPSLSGIQKLEQLEAVHARIDPQLRSILNPRQYQKLQEIRDRDIREAINWKLHP
jgi:type II secretory pathway component PulM